MDLWAYIRKLLAYLAPELGYPGIARKQIAVITALLAVAAIAGAVVLKPSRDSKPAPWGDLRVELANRAQVDLFEDFSTGLDSWQRSDDLSNPD